MSAFHVQLPPDLARFVTDAVADGSWASADELFAFAVGLARTASVLGKPPMQTPAPVVASPPPPPAPTPAAPPFDSRKTPAAGVPAVDLTRLSFDSSAFMGDLTRKLHGDKK